MPIAVRTNVAFDSHSSRLVRKKAARTEAGVVVLESPAIVQERLAPLSFSNSNGRQLATLDLVGVVSALTDPDAGRRAEVARYLLLQAHQRQPSELHHLYTSIERDGWAAWRSRLAAGRGGDGGGRGGGGGGGGGGGRGGSLAGVATAAVAAGRLARGGRAAAKRGGGDAAAGKPMDSKERDEIIAELREYADALGRELRKRGAAARGGKPDARAASGDGVIEIRPEAAMLDTLRAGKQRELAARPRPKAAAARGGGGGGVRAAAAGGAESAVLLCKAAWEGGAAGRLQAVLRFEAPGIATGDRVIVVGPTGGQHVLLVPPGVMNVRRVLASVSERAQERDQLGALQLDIVGVPRGAQPGDELSVQRVPLTLPWYAVPAASLVVALPAALPEGDEPTPLFAPRAAVAPSAAVTWRAPPTPSAPPVPWQQEAEESWQQEEEDEAEESGWGLEVEESADLDGFEQSQTWSATGEWDRV